MTTSSALAAQAALDAELARVVALDRVIRAAQAEQYQRIDAARVLATAVEGVSDASSAVDREFATRAFVAELATALVVHEASAGGLVADAGKLTGEFTATLDALAAGSICAGRVRSLLEVASTLPAGCLAGFEAAALDARPGETPSGFRRRIRRLRERIHPEPLAARRQRARDQRRVCLEPVEDGMAWLNLYLEAERGVAIIAHLDALADAQQPAAGIAAGPGSGSGSGGGSGEAGSGPRTRTQLMLDLAAGLLLGRSEEAGGSPLGVVVPRVYLTVPVLTMLGHSDGPAELDGYGPIDPDTALQLAAHAPSFRRILTHPETGAYLSYGRKSYRVPADLAGYLRVRDGGCRFPGCSRRAASSDIDHTRDWAAGGSTSHENLAHLCRKHHRLKHNTGWQMTQLPGGDIRWTSPTGREYTSTPTNPFTRARLGEVPSAGGGLGAGEGNAGEAPNAGEVPNAGEAPNAGAASNRVIERQPDAEPPTRDEPATGVRPISAPVPELPEDPPWAARAA